MNFFEEGRGKKKAFTRESIRRWGDYQRCRKCTSRTRKEKHGQKQLIGIRKYEEWGGVGF